MNPEYLRGIQSALSKEKEEARKRQNVRSRLMSLIDAISEAKRVAGEDMTTECIMELLNKNR